MVLANLALHNNICAIIISRMGNEINVRRPLENIEDVDIFYEAIQRKHLTKALSPERPYTYWTIELYDQKNGIRGGGGLGVLAADTRRVAEKMHVPFTLITPFYPYEVHQKMQDGQNGEEHIAVDYHKFGFKFIDTVKRTIGSMVLSLLIR